MEQKKSEDRSSDRTRVPVIALPVALYVSGDLIFELYNGGLPCRLMRSGGNGWHRWEQPR